MSAEDMNIFSEKADQACAALVKISQICEITQQYSVTMEELEDLRGYVTVWNDLLKANFYPKVFTANMHYISHIYEAVQVLGLLRLFSARIMERANGMMKDDINSRKDPVANTSNCMKNHFAKVLLHSENSISFLGQ